MNDQILEELIKIRQLLEKMQLHIPVVGDNWGTMNTPKPDCGCPPYTVCGRVSCPRVWR
jgi:hypothetical protein